MTLPGIANYLSLIGALMLFGFWALWSWLMMETLDSTDKRLTNSRAENERLRDAVEDLTLAAAAAGTTLESVDPNAPCVDQIDEAIGKHLRYTAPVLRAHSEQEATDAR